MSEANDRRTPTLGELLGMGAVSALADVHTAIPAKVVSYDASTQRCSAQPLIKSRRLEQDGTYTAASRAIVTEVPVLFPGAGAYRLTFPIDKGDGVLLIFAEASIDRWVAKGSEVDPGDNRRFSGSDGIAIPGLVNQGGTPDSSAMVLEASEIKLGSKSASDPVARKSDLDALKTYIDAHVHSGGTLGGGLTGVPDSPSPSPGTSIVKAD